MKKKVRKPKPILTIGRRETVDFPDLGLFGLTAKIDTGANTTALHCHHVRVENGVLHFRLLDESHPEYRDTEHRFTTFEQKVIKSSMGESELRYIIRTRIKIGSRTLRGIVSLTDRANMKYPVLIGRRLIKNRFLVDVSKLNLVSTAASIVTHKT